MTRKKTAKRKVEIVFDPEKRKEFLSGFQKRKNERRKKAKDDLDRNLKEERKRIRQEVKDGLKHLKKSHEPLRELTEEDKADKEAEYEDDDVKVKIVELSTNDFATQTGMLGANQAAADSDDDADKRQESTDEDELAQANCIPGMDFDVNKAKKRKRKLTHGPNGDDDDDGTNATAKRSKTTPPNGANVEVKNKKELDRLKKTKTLKQLKKSKLFKQKERLDKTANQKKVRRDRNNTLRSLPKNQQRKKKKTSEPSHYRKGRLMNRKQIRKMKQNH